MRIGFNGLDQMGGAIAANLVKAGHTVTVRNRSAEKADALVDAGASRADRLVTRLGRHRARDQERRKALNRCRRAAVSTTREADATASDSVRCRFPAGAPLISVGR